MNFNLIQNKEEPKYFVVKTFEEEGDIDYIKANNQDVLDLFDQVVAELKEYRKR